MPRYLPSTQGGVKLDEVSEAIFDYNREEHDLLYLAWLLYSRHDGYMRCVRQSASADVNVAASVRVVEKTSPRVVLSCGVEPQIPLVAVPVVEEASVARVPTQAAGWGCRVEITVKWRQRAKAKHKQTPPRTRLPAWKEFAMFDFDSAIFGKEEG